MTTETSNARGEWVLVPRWNMERVAETLERDGDEHGAAYELRDMLAAAPPPAAVRGDVRGLVAKWRRYADGNFDDAANARSRCADELESALAAEGVQAEARGVVDEARAVAIFNAAYPPLPSETYAQFGLRCTKTAIAALTGERNG